MIKRLFQSAALIYSSILGLLMLLEPLLLFPAPSPDTGIWDAKLMKAGEEWISSKDGTRVHVWCLKHPQPKATVVFSHGNGETLGLTGWQLAQIRDRWSVNVVSYDYRGYGKTGGPASQKSILEDAVAVGKWVQSTGPWNQVPIIPLGRSLGGAAAIEMADSLQSPALILDRTFSSAVDVAADRYPIFPVRLVMRNQFPSIDKLKNYQAALFQLHGDIDRVIPYQFGKKLFDQCPSSCKELLTVQGLTHLDPWPEEFWDKGKRFIESVQSQP